MLDVFSDIPWPMEQAGYTVQYEINSSNPPVNGDDSWFCYVNESSKEASCYEVRALRGGSFCTSQRNFVPFEHPMAVVRWEEQDTNGYFWTAKQSNIPQGGRPSFGFSPSMVFTFDRYEMVPFYPTCQSGAGCSSRARYFIKNKNTPLLFKNTFEYTWNPDWTESQPPLAFGGPMEIDYPCRGFFVFGSL